MRRADQAARTTFSRMRPSDEPAAPRAIAQWMATATASCLWIITGDQQTEDRRTPSAIALEAESAFPSLDLRFITIVRHPGACVHPLGPKIRSG